MAMSKESIRRRQVQERIATVLKDGYWKETIRLQSALFKEYIKRGFTRDEALEIIIARIQADNWDIEPQLGKKEQTDGQDLGEKSF